MRYVILLLMTIGLSACGKQFQDPAVGDIVNQFVQDAAAHGKNLQVNNEIEFGNVGTSDEGTVLARCVYDNVDNLLNGKIVIDRTWWDGASTLNRKMVIYHELGHCALHRSHDQDMESLAVTYQARTYSPLQGFTNQTVDTTIVAPISIMHPSVPTDSEIGQAGSDYYNNLLQELFK